MAAKEKDTIYIDIDDEITGIIDKVKASDAQVTALVLPKRASVFQSIVNMKLLKRAADSADKNLVLITTEAGLMPLAGAAGIHVAKTLTSKPEIPLGPQPMDDAEESVEEPTELPEPLTGEKTVGQLAGNTPPPPPADGGVETLVLDDEDLPPEEEAVAAADKPAKPKTPKNKKLKVPNFERFRLLLILAGLAIVLIIAALIFATVALPKATITIKTDATNVDTNLNLNLSTTAKSLDPSSGTLPAKLASQQKTYSQQVPTTGQKNNGNKATGSITMKATVCNNPNPFNPPSDVPAGSGVSTNNQTYITQQDTSFTVNGATVNGNGCDVYPATSSTPIIAQSGGTSYNVSGVPFTVASRSDVTGNGSASNGTDNIVQTVNQNDINGAKNKITSDDSAMKQALDSQLKGENQYPIEATYQASQPTVTTSANVGDQATSVTVTEVFTYTTFGVNKDDLNSLINDQINGQIDTSKQSILDNGLGQAVFNINTISSSAAQLTMSTKAIAGPALDVNGIKQMAAGKRIGDIKSQISNNPDVTDVEVKLSPFWITTAPKKISRIVVNIAKPTTTKASSSASSP